MDSTTIEAMEVSGKDRPVLFMCHALGGSAQAWQGVVAALGHGYDCVAFDLPGFGEAGAAADLTVSGAVEHVAGVIRARGAARWLLVGHSMGAKIASIVAARTLSGEPGLFGLAGVVLLAGSPPSPEPMDEAQRSEMLGWAAAGALDDAAARAFVDGNVGAPLTAACDRVAIDDLKRSMPEAWRAWLERGSREDWSAEVGVLDLPALVVAGGADGALGEQGQRAVHGTVYPRARFVVAEGAGHLLPFERPQWVAEAIHRFWHDAAGLGPATPPAYAHVVASDRVSRRMRAALARRALADDPGYAPKALTAQQLETLRVVAGRVVPQMPPAIDLAARVDAALADGAGDGWRFAGLPEDRVAYARALDGLGSAFAASDGDAQDACLGAVAAGVFEPAADDPSAQVLSSAQMTLWFEDARSDLVRQWVAHPATMAAIGFDGFANGGDGSRKQGFARLAAGEHEAWEPMLEASR